jgi:hypothetical protein
VVTQRVTGRKDAESDPARAVLHGLGVTHRLDIHAQGRTVVLALHGFVDEAALATLRVSLALAVQAGADARIVLPAGTEVERSCLDALRGLGVEVVAESPYLAAWLAGSGS